MLIFICPPLLLVNLVPLRKYPPYAMPLPDRGLAVRVFHVSVAMVLAGSLLSLSIPTVILDRNEWVNSSAAPLSKKAQPGPKRVLAEGCLRRLVHDCSRRIGIEDLRCEEHVGPEDDFRTPRDSTRPSCGFEVRFERDAIALRRARNGLRSIYSLVV